MLISCNCYRRETSFSVSFFPALLRRFVSRSSMCEHSVDAPVRIILWFFRFSPETKSYESDTTLIWNSVLVRRRRGRQSLNSFGCFFDRTKYKISSDRSPWSSSSINDNAHKKQQFFFFILSCLFPLHLLCVIIAFYDEIIILVRPDRRWSKVIIKTRFEILKCFASNHLLTINAFFSFLWSLSTLVFVRSLVAWPFGRIDRFRLKCSIYFAQ